MLIKVIFKNIDFAIRKTNKFFIYHLYNNFGLENSFIDSL